MDDKDQYVILGDFNARVGSRLVGEADDGWERTRGPFGVGEVNDAGRELLSFPMLLILLEVSMKATHAITRYSTAAALKLEHIPHALCSIVLANLHTLVLDLLIDL